MEIKGYNVEIETMAHNVATIYAQQCVTKFLAQETKPEKECAPSDITQAYLSAYCAVMSYEPGYLQSIIRALE